MDDSTRLKLEFLSKLTDLMAEYGADWEHTPCYADDPDMPETIITLRGGQEIRFETSLPEIADMRRMVEDLKAKG